MVTATSANGESAPSNEAAAAPLAPAPAAPVILSALGGNGQVALTWSAPQYAQSYAVYRGTASGGEAPTPVASNLGTATYTDSGLTDGTPYYYTVVATDNGGSSSPSSEVMATPYAAPAGATGVGGDRVVLLTWSPVASANGVEYLVSRSSTPGGPYTSISGNTAELSGLSGQ